jgi:FkbH-like protein
MSSAHSDTSPTPSATGGAQLAKLALISSFTVDPIVDPLLLLLRETGLQEDLDVAVMPYGQVFQELLDPGRQFARNTGGINVVLLRFEDWAREANGTPGHLEPAVAARNLADLISAITAFAAASPTPLVVFVAPPSPAACADASSRARLDALGDQLHQGIAGLASVRVLGLGQVWPTVAGDSASIHDPEGDRLGHIPYTPLFFAALARALARLTHAIKRPPHKVLVLDCDNTLWKGVVGEDGVQGIELTPAYLALQRFVLAKKNAGMLICLASKNVEADVLDVLQARPDMLLRPDDVVSLRVNWLPKSQNIHDLAAELNLGLDSFVFIDDNPVECAEVEANCPGVLVLNLPIQQDFVTFLQHVWPLDLMDVTDEDRRRTAMYQENLARDRYQKSASTLGDFLAGLDLHIDIVDPRPDLLPRLAQLTMRTNQFNFSTRRRSEAEIARLSGESGCRAVMVRDRFGDYGLVGETIFVVDRGVLQVDTFLLSCRVLGRGVEHAMLRDLGQIARARGIDQVVARFLTTKKNQPARRFLDGLAIAARQPIEGGTDYSFDASALVDLADNAAADPAQVAPSELERNEPGKIAPPRPAASARWNRLALDLVDPAQILAAVERASLRVRQSPALMVAPRNDIERKLGRIWQETLRLAEVGVQDDYFELGGTSLQAVTVCARIERELGRRLPLSVLSDCPTIAALAGLLEGGHHVEPLVLLAAGGPEPPLFLVHDADGETLLYRNLARRLAGVRSVYGIQPRSRAHAAITCTRIEDMAALYVAEIRRICPQGPYFLGGLCAGGILAFEMARQLEAAGDRAYLAAVFDAADVEAAPRPYLQAARSLGRVRSAMQAAPLSHLPRVLVEKAWGLLSYQMESRVTRLRGRLAVNTLRMCLDRDLPLPPWARDLSVRLVYLFAESQYRPRAGLQEEIVLYRATAGQGDDEPYVQRYADPLLGWGRRTAKGVRAIDVPGGHGSMLQEPHVATVATCIANYLAALPRPASLTSPAAAAPPSELLRAARSIQTGIHAIGA